MKGVCALSHIRILPEIVANKIAAGEMIERPAAVVKELVENALDAGATRLVIEIEDGGRRLIQVADDGCGMTPDDAMLCIERFATSKVPADGDLFAVATLGFRGEALPSIASVSRFSLVTRLASAESATRIQITGGRLEQVSEAGAPPGTLVSVRDLFFNTPARRKFLKTVATEMAHISDLVSSLALGRPDVACTLRHNGRVSQEWPATSQIAARVRDILGQEAQQHLCEVSLEDTGMRLTGWLVPPPVFRPSARGVHIFVNGRLVKDRVMQHALFEAFAGRLTRGQYPLAVLWLTVPTADVDINVHPTKQEVRFIDARKVHDLVLRGVTSALAGAVKIPWKAPSETTVPRSFHESLGDGVVETGLPGRNWSRPKSPSTGDGNASFPAFRASRTPPPETNMASNQEPLWSPTVQSRLRVIGQFQRSYIVCESERELLLVDQHAAHERILFERLQKTLAGHLKETLQQFLLPETLELTHHEVDVLQQMLPEIQALGFDVEAFGGQTFVVKSAPAFLAETPIQTVLREMIEKAASMGFATQLDRRQQAYLHLLACHGAIRAHQPLSTDQMQKLLQQLEACDDPAHCPHGRPVWVTWSLSMLERLFKR